MDIGKFKDSPAGRILKTNRDYWAFVPNPLPPAIKYTKELVNSLSKADRHLGNLNGISTLVPNPYMLIMPYVRREAVMSSKIEGTQTSLSELFYFEAARKDEQKKKAEKTDVLEVLNYVKAINYGIKRLDELPLCLRLIREMHKVLMKGVRGQHMAPGEFRRSQNWIGPPGCTLNEAIFVPPPAHKMNQTLRDFEKFLHDKENLPGLIQCALIHYQFEAIHPFLDGNGRIGRLLITLFLCERQYIAYPMLYLSSFFSEYRNEYYNKLLAVSQRGEWGEWIMFFLRAITAVSKDAIENSKAILSLLEDYKTRIQKKRISSYAFKLLDELFKNPYTSIPRAAKKLKTSYHTAKAVIERFVETKILFEITNKRRGKIYYAKELLDLLEGESKVNNKK